MKISLTLLSLALASGAALATTSVPLDDAKVEAAMKLADPDSDGTLDMKEASKFGIGKAAFLKADPDKDGKLDKGEFAAALTAQFVAADPDKDGSLDWKEAKKAGVKSKKAFEAGNPDKDGHLDINEYLAALVAQFK